MLPVVVVGAGCFGVWTAWRLVMAGHAVTLVDAYGPGNARSSSGGATRLIRMGYGAEEIYTDWSLRSLAMWQALSARSPAALFHKIGVLWMARDQDPLAAATLATLERAGVLHQRLSRAELEVRWPQIQPGEITWAIVEPESGVLMAQRAVEVVAREAAQAGARVIAGAVASPASNQGRSLDAVATAAGETIHGATFVFACGPWLPALFPGLLGDRIFATRQEVLYFGPPAGDLRFAPPALPAWIDFGAEVYGVPDIEGRGFKISVDRHGPQFDPDRGDRTAIETEPAVRSYLADRFPALRDAPLVGAEVCQYENTSNGDFLIDRHPDFDNVWLVGGGSGHGFKHGPMVGEYVARLVSEGGSPDARFSLATKERMQRREVY
jgi:monomeric sarcosine oxidase